MATLQNIAAHATEFFMFSMNGWGENEVRKSNYLPVQYSSNQQGRGGEEKNKEKKRCAEIMISFKAWL